MKSRALLILGSALLPLLHGAEWSKLTSPNFELYTTSGEREGRQTLETFEQVRDFFARVKKTDVTTRLPVTIVAFGSQREYKPYGMSEFAPAYSVADEQHDYIVMSDLGNDRTLAAIHEYVHVLVRHSGLKMPLWLNEGLADVYSTMQARDGQIVVGSIPKGRAYSLTQENWMRLGSLVRVGPTSSEYNEQDRASIFYAQSWLLAHMLMLGDGYADKFSTFVNVLSASGSSQVAFSDVYGKTLPEIEKEMNAYFRQSTIGGVAYNTGFQKVEVGKAQSPTELEIDLTLAKLVELLGRSQEAEKRMEQLAATHRDAYEVDEALAYLEWRKGDRAAAVRHFQLALAHGATSWKTYWDYARSLASGEGDREPLLPTLRKTLELKPDLTDARLLLGQELHRTHQYAEALAELRQIKSVDPERAAVMYLAMAHLALELKQESDARQYAEEAKKYAQEPNEVSGAEKLLEYLQQNNASARDATSTTAVPPASELVDDPGRPTLRHRGSQSPAPKAPPRK